MEGSRWRGLGGGTYVKGTRWSVESGRRVWGTLGTQLPRYTYEPLQTFSCHIDLIGSHGSVRSVPTVPWKIISVRFTTVRFHSVRFHTVQVPPVPRLGSQPPCSYSLISSGRFVRFLRFVRDAGAAFANELRLWLSDLDNGKGVMLRYEEAP